MTAFTQWSKNAFPAKLIDGSEIWYNDLDKTSITYCTMAIGLRLSILKMTRKESLEAYIKLNRGGIVHTEEEIEKVRELLRKEKDD